MWPASRAVVASSASTSRAATCAEDACSPAGPAYSTVAGRGPTVTVAVPVPAPPSLSVAVSVAVYVPGFAYVCDTAKPAAVGDPSPKSQLAVRPACVSAALGSVAAPAMLSGTPHVAARFGPASTVGATLSTSTVTAAVVVPPLPSSAVTVTCAVAGPSSATRVAVEPDGVSVPTSVVHVYVSASPSTSAPCAVSVTGEPSPTGGGWSSVTVGGSFTGVIAICIVATRDVTRPSNALNVNESVPL